MNGPNCMDMWAVLPEMALAGLALLLVPVAGLARGRWKIVPAWATSVGLAVSMVLTMRMWQMEPIAAFCGTYAVDRFAIFYKLLIEGAALLVLPMLASHFRGHRSEAHAPLPLLFATTGALGLVSSLDLGLILLFLQVVSIASYLLVLLVRSDHGAQEASLKYFIYAAAALGIMGYGMTFLYGLTGRLDLLAIGHALRDADPVWIIVAIGLVSIGYSFEITLVPFQFWAPDVYQGATAPAAGFIAVVPKIAAFAALLRLLLEALSAYDSAWSAAAALTAAATMTLGNLGALRQRRLKRLLAYSSIAQAGYMLMGAAVGLRSDGAIPAVNFYLLAYLLMNLAAFAVVAALEKETGTDKRSVLRGLTGRSPWLALMFAVALLSLAGIPPLAGFTGKVLLLAAAIDGGMTWLALIAAVNMAIGLFYYARLIADMFFTSAAHEGNISVKLGYICVGALASTGTLALGIAPQMALSFAIAAAWIK